MARPCVVWPSTDMVSEITHPASKEFGLIYLFTLTANGVLPGGSGTTIRHNIQITHNTQITHHPQTKHITQNYTNNEGHTTHDEYNANTITTTTRITTTMNKK
jgi:hypothetical protein